MDIKTLVLSPLSTNCYLVKTGEGRGVVIDPADEGEKILEKAADMGIEIKKILLTHGHFDHTGAVNIIKANTKAEVYIHEKDECMLSDGDKALAYFCPEIPFEHKTADVLVKDNDTITDGDVTFKVMYTPGHSAGSVCYVIESIEETNIMFAGDTIFRDSIGRCDGYSGDFIVQKETLEKLKNLTEDYIIYSGHGPSTTLKTEKMFNPFIS